MSPTWQYKNATPKQIDDFMSNPLPKLRYDEVAATKSEVIHTNKVLLINVVPDHTFESRCEAYKTDLIGRFSAENTDIMIEETFFDSMLYRMFDKQLCASESSTERRIAALVTDPVDLLIEALDTDSTTSCHHVIAGESRTAAAQIRKYKSFSSQEQAFQFCGLSEATEPRQSERNKATASTSEAATRSTMPETFVDLATFTLPGRQALLFGEVKVPWKHSLRILTRLWVDDDQEAQLAQKEARILLAQIVSYMQKFKLRFGYLTTYAETVFLELTHDLEGDEWYVKCSPVVYWDGVARYHGSNPQEPGRSSYTLRTAMAMIRHAACQSADASDGVFDARIIGSTVAQGRKDPARVDLADNLLRLSISRARADLPPSRLPIPIQSPTDNGLALPDRSSVRVSRILRSKSSVTTTMGPKLK